MGISYFPNPDERITAKQAATSDGDDLRARFPRKTRVPTVLFKAPIAGFDEGFTEACYSYQVNRRCVTCFWCEVKPQAYTPLIT